MYLAGLRDEYAFITDTWHESAMTLEKTKTNFKVKAVRVEQRIAREHNGKATGFQASTTPPMFMEQMQRRVRELESMVARAKAPTFGNGASCGTTRQSGGHIFRGVCYGCGERGHRRSEWVNRLASQQSANQAAATRPIDEDLPVAFLATLSTKSWAYVVRQEIQPARRDAEIVAVVSRTNVEVSAPFMAKTPPRNYGCPRSSAQEKHARWCIDVGASDHMTNCKADFLCFRPSPKV